jgi:prevent-host-death family protein
MEKSISAAEANRKFSQVLRHVKEGQSYVVTSHGRPVARIAPVKPKQGKIGDSTAWRRLMRRIKSQPTIDIGPWTRDELYD